MNNVLKVEVEAIQSISAVPVIMRGIAQATGLRFVCINHVTPQSWTACAVLDNLNFGLKPGDELLVATTLCDEVRAKNATIVIDHVSKDEVFHDHPTPKMYGFESYFSIPIYGPGGVFFGTLCGLDPSPNELSNPQILDTLKVFADIISAQLASEEKFISIEKSLFAEREKSKLRDQFIAILGHDLRTPLSSMLAGAEALKMLPLGETALKTVDRMKRSGHRITSLINDVMDFAHGEMGNGLSLNMGETKELGYYLEHIVRELESTHDNVNIERYIDLDHKVYCDPTRIGQMISNLVINAIIHGDKDQPIKVDAYCRDELLSISVSNKGGSISEETMSRLFQPFWRNTTDKHAGGLGLGLYIASEIARSHQGKLEVMSNNNITTFTFTVKTAR